MKNSIVINSKINSYNKTISVSGDKSLSIRWALLASQSFGKSKAFILLKSEDVINTLKSLEKLGTKVNHIMRHTVGLYHGQILSLIHI